jgi:hypothetical protein
MGRTCQVSAALRVPPALLSETVAGLWTQAVSSTLITSVGTTTGFGCVGNIGTPVVFVGTNDASAFTVYSRINRLLLLCVCLWGPQSGQTAYNKLSGSQKPLLGLSFAR